jgi:hypothetical protein
MICHCTVVKLIEYDNIEIIYSEVSMTKVIKKDFREKQKYVEFIEILSPLFFSDRYICLFYDLRLV